MEGFGIARTMSRSAIGSLGHASRGPVESADRARLSVAVVEFVAAVALAVTVRDQYFGAVEFPFIPLQSREISRGKEVMLEVARMLWIVADVSTLSSWWEFEASELGSLVAHICRRSYHRLNNAASKLGAV